MPRYFPFSFDRVYQRINADPRPCGALSIATRRRITSVMAHHCVGPWSGYCTDSYVILPNRRFAVEMSEHATFSSTNNTELVTGSQMTPHGVTQIEYPGGVSILGTYPISVGARDYAVDISDFDGDGILGILVGTDGGGFDILLGGGTGGQSDGTFTLATGFGSLDNLAHYLLFYLGHEYGWDSGGIRDRAQQVFLHHGIGFWLWLRAKRSSQ